MFASFLEVILFLLLGLVIESGNIHTKSGLEKDGIIPFWGKVCAIHFLVRGLPNAMVRRILKS